MNETLHFQGRTYRLGTPGTPLELSQSGILPPQPPDGWREIPDPFGVGRDYCRCYAQQTGGLKLISSAELRERKRWLHVSVSHRGGRLPTWGEMCEIKTLFCGADSTAYQIHPPASKHVSIHDKCLHLWCCLDGAVTPDMTGGGETI
jgi:hypothetical protein